MSTRPVLMQTINEADSTIPPPTTPTRKQC